MGSGEEGDAVIVTAEAEIERTGALIVGRLQRGDGEAERGREGLAELGDRVDEGVEGEELRATHRARHLRLAESDLNLAWRRMSLTASAAVTAASKASVSCFTPIHISSRQNGIPSPASVKATGSIEVHLTRRASRAW